MQVVAHRGASGEQPEHTLAAYTQAIDAGADALECDVRLTRDGHLICVHDRRVDRTSNGRGVVSTLELADLADLDFGSWKDSGEIEDADGLITERWEEPDQDRSRVLTLEVLLEAVMSADRRVELAIETKHPTRYAGLVERELVGMLRRMGALDRARVMSFAPTSLRRIHFLAPTAPTVLLMERVPRRYRDGTLPSRVGIAGPSIEVLRQHPAYVARAQAAGHQVHVWTVDEPEDIELAVSLGVDAIITNHPARVLARIAR
ncbi:MAG: glycerophosphoryl diester phosphodiesterase [Frankiaceae bacterium]|nr:glycerophosphoryl diester phosphodiesterase [Frankiaceae bacterium]MDX6223764.1 glycerophosphoryl diester phosphodiesterase [Frankiales bacterium]MDX6274278.1 glycerophosphoryl diester phosphodiesterase [Frankiales bacterium]